MPHRHQILRLVQPVVHYGLREMTFTSPSHAMTEIAAITFLMGRGYDFPTAHRIVESWEVNETFPMPSAYVTPETTPLPQPAVPGYMPSMPPTRAPEYYRG